MDPTPRFDPPTNPGGIKEAAAPCGAAKPATAAHTYVMGSVITVKIEEIIDHPGHYELWWSNANDAGLAVIPGMDNIPNPVGKANTSVQLTLPNTLLDNGTLQMRMVMTDNPASPTNYYSCADIQLVAPGTDLAGQGPADLAIPSDADLAGFTETDDLSVVSGTDDGGTSEADLGKKAPADSAGLPGCSIVEHGSAATLPLALLLGMLFTAGMVPTLRRALARRKPR